MGKDANPQPGRSRPERLPVALFVASFSALAVIAGPVLADVTWGRLRAGTVTIEAIGDGVTVLSIVAPVAMAATLLFGIPAWAVLRGWRRETGRNYSLAGGLAGLAMFQLTNLVLDLPFAGSVLVFSLWGALAGTMAGLTFWWVIRGKMPRRLDAAPPTTVSQQ